MPEPARQNADILAMHIGSSAQTVQVETVTTEHDLFLMPDCSSSSLSDSNTELCNSGGSCSPDESTTSANDTSSMSHDYLDDSSVAPELYSDTITLPTGAIFSDSRFGVAFKSSGFANGILGLDYGQASETRDGKYPTFVDQLVLQNITNSKAFSLALGSKSTGSDGGVINFGGVDTKKFRGTLASTANIKPSDSSYTSGFYYINLTSVGISGGDPKIYTGSNAIVALASADTIPHVPSTIVDALNNDVGDGSACVSDEDVCI